MTLIDGDRIVTVQLYDDEYEEFTEKKMSIIDAINAYTDEGVTTADDVIDKIRADIEQAEFALDKPSNFQDDRTDTEKFADWARLIKVIMLEIIDKYKGESEE